MKARRKVLFSAVWLALAGPFGLLCATVRAGEAGQPTAVSRAGDGLAGLPPATVDSTRGGDKDVASYTFFKWLPSFQTGPGALQPNGAFLELDVNEVSAGTVAGASATFPNGSSQSFQQSINPDQWQILGDFPTGDEMESAFPPGAYGIHIQPVGEPDKNVVLTMGEPPVAPVLLNYTAAQAINAGSPFALQWNAFAGAGPEDSIQVSITNSAGNLVFLTPDFLSSGRLSGTDASLVLSAETLYPGQTYQLTLRFSKVTTLDPTSYPGTTGEAAYFTETFVNITAFSVFPVSQVPDVQTYSIIKKAGFTQSGADKIASDPNAPFEFEIEVHTSYVGASGACCYSVPQLQNEAVAGGITPVGPRDYSHDSVFASEARLDLSAPPVTVFLELWNGGDVNEPLTLAPAAFPNAPQLLNWPAAQSLDASQTFVAQWNPFLGGGTNDFIQIEINDASGNPVFATPDILYPGALNGLAVSAAIPAGTLLPGQLYQAQLRFFRVADLDTTSYPGAVGEAALVSATSFTLATVPAAPTAGTPDILLYTLTKLEAFIQSGPETVAPDPTAPFIFEAEVDESYLGSVQSASITSGTNAGGALAPGAGPLIWSLDSVAPGGAALDAAWPPGDYLFSIETPDAGPTNLSVTLRAADYPSPPVVTNFTAAQSVNSSNDFVLRWDAFAGAVAGDGIQLQIFDAGGNLAFSTPALFAPGALDSSTVSLTIPHGTLPPGQVCQATLRFGHVASLDTNSYPGAVGGAAFIAQTTFPIQTIAVSPPPLDIFLCYIANLQNWQEAADGSIAPAGAAAFQSSFGVYQSTTGLVGGALVYNPEGATPLTLPSGQTNINPHVQNNYSNQAEFNGNYQVGAYTFLVNTKDDGEEATTVVEPAASFPTAPSITNLTTAQTLNAANSLVLEWTPDPDPAPGQLTWLWIADPGGNVVFSTPSPYTPGAPGVMDAASSSVWIPAGTFQPGAAYTGHLEFLSLTMFPSAEYPGAPGAVIFSSATSFDLGTASSPPRFVAESYSASNGMTLTLSGVPLQNYAFQSSTDLAAWRTFAVTNSASGMVIVTDPQAANSARMFYRALAQ